MTGSTGDIDAIWSTLSPDGVTRIATIAAHAFAAADVCVTAHPSGTVIVKAGSPGIDAPHADRDRPLTAPIQLPDGRSVGSLDVLGEDGRRWTERDSFLAQEFAAWIGHELDRAARSAAGAVRDPAASRLVAWRERFFAGAGDLPCVMVERHKIDAATCRCSIVSRTPAPPQHLLRGADLDEALDALHEGDRDRVRSAVVASTIEETDLDVTFRVVDGSGATRWLRNRSIVEHRDGQAVWTGLCLDVTDEMAGSAAAGNHTNLDVNQRLAVPLQAIVSVTDALKGQPVLSASQVRTLKTAAETLLAIIGPAEDGGGADADEATSASHDPTGGENDGSPERQGARILLADDLDLNRKLICDMLSIEGHHVDGVADGAAAVKAAAEGSYDLILMDMIMPGMDGIAAARAIRALPSPASDVPIVALTAHSFREQLDGCLAAGMNATLTKPMSMDALTAAVLAWTRDRRAA